MYIAVGVFVTDIAHNRSHTGQRNCCRKFQSRKRRRKMMFMARMIIISVMKKLKSFFERRAWYNDLDQGLEKAQLKSRQHK